jgi:hypothetical protein
MLPILLDDALDRLREPFAVRAVHAEVDGAVLECPKVLNVRALEDLDPIKDVWIPDERLNLKRDFCGISEHD